MFDWRRVLALAFGVVMLASACSSPYKGLSKADYVKQANATCKSYDTKVTNAVSASGLTEKSSQDQQVTLLETKVVPLLRQQVADLRKLKPPKADRKQVKAIVDGMATGTDSAEHELKTNPKNALSSSFNPFTASDKLATAYGLTDCTSSSSG